MRSSKLSDWNPLDELPEVESNVEEPVVAFAVSHGWLVRKMRWIGRRGCPDRFFVRNGRIVLAEFKRQGKKTADPLQKKEIKRLRAFGVEVHLINDVEQGKKIFA